MGKNKTEPVPDPALTPAASIEHIDLSMNAKWSTPTEPATLDPMAPPAPIPDEVDWSKVDAGEWRIPLERITISISQPRMIFDTAEQEELTESMRDHGQRVAIEVRPIGDGNFELIAGERRFRSASMLGWQAIRATVTKEDDDGRAALLSIIDNIHRSDLTEWELAHACHNLIRKGVCSDVADVAAKLKRGKRVMHQIMQLTDLIRIVADALRAKQISFSHAALICRLDPADQGKALDACFEPELITEGGTHERVERLVSEKRLRAWIKEHITGARLDDDNRPEKESDPEAEQRAAAEAAGTHLLERNGLDANGAEADAEDDDDTEDGETPFKPAASQDAQSGLDAKLKAQAEEREARKIVEFRKIVGEVGWPLSSDLIWIACLRGSYGMDEERAKRVLYALGHSYVASDFREKLKDLCRDRNNDNQMLARILMAMTLVSDTFEAYSDDHLIYARQALRDLAKKRTPPDDVKPVSVSKKPTKKAAKKPVTKKPAKKKAKK